ncbi:uncharacterized protein PAN0_003d1623 [Moesziomyces antarcticus]|uniref:Uncharacterized protein n=1 Tax=Pseudozyma antarctica TaxID=84753 RepID=A0A5C3FI56_PSEA2|nr:uncharacterized protein PAN0_003d1623 [Moesziomyces antarcticus]GAK63419.1 hypothetical protein PAN0_003d1623 [Moesziomyces antarcticus]SPO44004.1 uncharacterized protein PSANT_01689 [Moesziomyces antarcticus]
MDDAVHPVDIVGDTLQPDVKPALNRQLWLGFPSALESLVKKAFEAIRRPRAERTSSMEPRQRLSTPSTNAVSGVSIMSSEPLADPPLLLTSTHNPCSPEVSDEYIIPGAAYTPDRSKSDAPAMFWSTARPTPVPLPANKGRSFCADHRLNLLYRPSDNDYKGYGDNIKGLGRGHHAPASNVFRSIYPYLDLTYTQEVRSQLRDIATIQANSGGLRKLVNDSYRIHGINTGKARQRSKDWRILFKYLNKQSKGVIIWKTSMTIFFSVALSVIAIVIAAVLELTIIVIIACFPAFTCVYLLAQEHAIKLRTDLANSMRKDLADNMRMDLNQLIGPKTEPAQLSESCEEEDPVQALKDCMMRSYTHGNCSPQWGDDFNALPMTPIENFCVGSKGTHTP